MDGNLGESKRSDPLTIIILRLYVVFSYPKVAKKLHLLSQWKHRKISIWEKFLPTFQGREFGRLQWPIIIKVQHNAAEQRTCVLLSKKRELGVHSLIWQKWDLSYGALLTRSPFHHQPLPPTKSISLPHGCALLFQNFCSWIFCKWQREAPWCHGLWHNLSWFAPWWCRIVHCQQWTGHELGLKNCLCHWNHLIDRDSGLLQYPVNLNIRKIANVLLLKKILNTDTLWKNLWSFWPSSIFILQIRKKHTLSFSPGAIHTCWKLPLSHQNDSNFLHLTTSEKGGAVLGVFFVSSLE